MSHYHVGSNIPGFPPDGEVLTFASLDEARTQLVASLASDRDAYATDYPGQAVTITWDDDPDVKPGTSAWVTVGDDVLSRYYWAGAAHDAASDACDCEDEPAMLCDWTLETGLPCLAPARLILTVDGLAKGACERHLADYTLWTIDNMSDTGTITARRVA